MVFSFRAEVFIFLWYKSIYRYTLINFGYYFAFHILDRAASAGERGAFFLHSRSMRRSLCRVQVGLSMGVLLACSYRICVKIIHVQWFAGNNYISRMTVNKITIWKWRWRVWKVKKVRKTVGTSPTGRRMGSTTKVNR